VNSVVEIGIGKKDVLEDHKSNSVAPGLGAQMGLWHQADVLVDLCDILPITEV